MTNPMTPHSSQTAISERLLELAERVEKATGPDRALMCAAFQAIFPEVSSGAWSAIDAWDTRYDRFCAMLDVGAHLDAAMTLVPEPTWWWVEAQPLVHGAYLAGCGDERVSRGATPALALCAAALRATEHHHEPD